MRPDDRVGGRRHGPSSQRFALQERAQHAAFDRDAPAIHRQHFDEVVVRAEDLDDERRVAAALHAEPRTPELRFGERSAKFSQAVEAAPRVGRQQDPRRAAARVEREAARRGLATRLRTRRSRVPTSRRAPLVCLTRASHWRGGARRSTTDRRRRRKRRTHARWSSTQHELRPVREQSPHASAGERPPELHGKQKRHRSAGSQKLERTFDEQRRDVDLRRESASGARGARAGLPRRRSRDRVLASKRCSLRLRNPMSAHPRRVADDDSESAAGRDVGEMRGEAERKRAAVEDSASKRAKRRGRPSATRRRRARSSRDGW